MARSKLDEATIMQRALQLAARGRGRVEPNPMVGCVIVKRGQVIGEGCHRRFGGPHAEVDALKRCRTSPRGATAFVTLEPCCHFGKTPPCAEALIQAGISRAVVALRDPNSGVSGRGVDRLRTAGIRVDIWLLRDQAAELNAPFVKLVREKRPWVIAKWAQSLDGRIATRRGDSKWISDERCRAHAHRVRGRMDAIIVGRGTVMADDPQLTARLRCVPRVATRIVLDTDLRLPATTKLVRTARRTPTWVVCARRAPDRRVRVLETAGCVVHRVARAGNQLSLPAILDYLGSHGMTNVLVEGGGHLLGHFVEQRLVDEVHVYVAPLLIGGSQAISAIEGRGPATIRQALRLPETTIMKRLGSGWFAAAKLRSR